MASAGEVPGPGGDPGRPGPGPGARSGGAVDGGGRWCCARFRAEGAAAARGGAGPALRRTLGELYGLVGGCLGEEVVCTFAGGAEVVVRVPWEARAQLLAAAPWLAQGPDGAPGALRLLACSPALGAVTHLSSEAVRHSFG